MRPTLFTLALFASSSTLAEIPNFLEIPDPVDTPKFSASFDDYGVNNNWGLFNNSDLDTPMLSPQTRGAIQIGSINFDVNWTLKTLKARYPNAFSYYKSKKEIKEFRALAEAACPAVLELGQASIYGISNAPDAIVAELDSHLRCGVSQSSIPYGDQNIERASSHAANVRLHALLDTVPGAIYAVNVAYQQRQNGPSQHDNLFLRVGKETRELEYHGNVSSEGPFLEDGLVFMADKFKTKIALRDLSEGDTYGALINSIELVEYFPNPNESTCKTIWGANSTSKSMKNCLIAESEPELLGCDLSQAKVSWRKGDNTSHASFRNVAMDDDLRPYLHDDQALQFQSLGRKGKFHLQLKENGVNAACHIEGKTLNLTEVTWGNHNYESYAERGLVKIKVRGCRSEETNGWHVVHNNGDTMFKTNSDWSIDLTEVVGDAQCHLTRISIIDQTHKIKPSQAGYVSNSDGIDVSNISIE
ncbi:hypothetical protein N9R79_01495 [Vibrio sp.]|nr:hypothetical protein [Vibrio sp.]